MPDKDLLLDFLEVGSGCFGANFLSTYSGTTSQRNLPKGHLNSCWSDFVDGESDLSLRLSLPISSSRLRRTILTEEVDPDFLTTFFTFLAFGVFGDLALLKILIFYTVG